MKGSVVWSEIASVGVAVVGERAAESGRSATEQISVTKETTWTRAGRGAREVVERPFLLLRGISAGMRGRGTLEAQRTEKPSLRSSNGAD